MTLRAVRGQRLEKVRIRTARTLIESMQQYGAWPTGGGELRAVDETPDVLETLLRLDWHAVGGLAQRRVGELWASQPETCEVAAASSTDDRIVLEQLKRNQETNLGSVLVDHYAVDLLGLFLDLRRLELGALGKRLSSPQEWLAFGKLLRAELVKEVGESLVLTSLGKEKIEGWQKSEMRSRG